MITSSLTGNLGNHMWIYAITRAVAEHNGYEWGFNPSPEYDYYNGMPQMDFMDIDYGVTHEFKYNEAPPWISHNWHESGIHFSIPFTGDQYDFHDYQPQIFQVKDGTKLYIVCCQDARYLADYYEKVKKWFTIKEEMAIQYEYFWKQYGVDIDEDLTVLNIRGGEYKGVPSLILQQKYWMDAIEIMKQRNHRMKFICISDDPHYAYRLLDFKMPVIHKSIGADYWMINNAKNLILSNSSFAIFPTWLNENNPFVIAPFGWARHNVSTGYWASSAIWTFPWNFLDRNGSLQKGLNYGNI